MNDPSSLSIARDSEPVTKLAQIPANGDASKEAVNPRLVKLGKRLPALPSDMSAPLADWIAASPRKIEKALARALQRPTGAWFVLGARRRLLRSLGKGPVRQFVAGREFVLWLAGEEVRVAPNACPHMGARLDGAKVREGQLVCPWHGLELGDTARGTWRCHRVHDDGVLLWAQIPEPGQSPTSAPPLPARPATFLDGVIELQAQCEPQDILANRLDPWHGVHLHPYGFAELAVTQELVGGDADHMRLRVAKRVLGPICVEVDISFHCASARSIVMTILAGEGAGSVVETHATPMGPDPADPLKRPRCAIVEATLASSDRAGFEHANKVAGLIRPFIRRSALALWKDDLPYAQRLFELRHDCGSAVQVAVDEA